MTPHQKRCELCYLRRKDPVAYDDSLFCTYDGALTLIAKPILRFIAVRGCASFQSEDKETVAKLVIKEEVINRAMQTHGGYTAKEMSDFKNVRYGKETNSR